MCSSRVLLLPTSETGQGLEEVGAGFVVHCRVSRVIIPTLLWLIPDPAELAIQLSAIV